MDHKPPIAVVGMGCVFPGAPTIERFWEHIQNRVHAVAEIPAHRWLPDKDQVLSRTHRPDRAVSRMACLVDRVTVQGGALDFDPGLLEGLDPICLLALEAGRQAFEACRSDTLDRRRGGVILAAIALPSDGTVRFTQRCFNRFVASRLFDPPADIAQDPPGEADFLSARVTGLPAALLAKALNLGGGSFTLDAACASSLYALKLACDELWSHRADLMLSGGVSRPECLYTQVGFSQLRALSPSGRCAPFDRDADGLVVGEGAGVLALKRLDDALAAGDTIYGLIRGIGLSNDTRGNLLAPDSEGQLRAMREAYRHAGWRPSDVDLIECHGTGTPAGDRTELASLIQLWQDEAWRPARCAIGSVKSMIGHLLTAAGAAGMIKTLLALQHHTLPPSLNFHAPPPESGLRKSPFRVQTKAQTWLARGGGQSRRAAVSAFGFGGINAHVLVEEWLERRPAAKAAAPAGSRKAMAATDPEAPQPVAIVGMQVHLGRLSNLAAFQQAVFHGAPALEERPPARWKGLSAESLPFTESKPLPGAYLEAVSLGVGEFQIPPNEISDILPQQLLMLRVAREALEDARLPLRALRPRMGAVIGIDFDFEASNYHFRWHLDETLRVWNRQYHLGLSEAELATWSEQLKAHSQPPLTAPRTLGALGGIVASRVAREFRLGGPSFVVSAEAAAGVAALEIAVRSLQQDETDLMLVGAVDLCGDVRAILRQNHGRAFSSERALFPFDRRAQGTLPGEGAVAVVLKRLDRALADQDRIYALVTGLGKASGTAIAPQAPEAAVYRRSLERCLADAGVSAAQVGYVETHGSAHPAEDALEAEALRQSFAAHADPNGQRRAVGALKPIVGHTGTTAGLAGVVKSALCLFHQLLPPLPGIRQPAILWREAGFHLPRSAQFWHRNRSAGPRRACVATLTAEGGSWHVLLQEPPPPPGAITASVAQMRRRPLGLKASALFVLGGHEPSDLAASLEQLQQQIQESLAGATDRPLEALARQWYQEHANMPAGRHSLTIAARDQQHIGSLLAQAAEAIRSGRRSTIEGPGGVAYNPEPLGARGEVIFVFPGSGNHYVGMGREVGVIWPEILRRMDADTEQLQRQLLPQLYTPWRDSWPKTWEQEALSAIEADPLHMIFGQVMHGGMMCDLVRHLGVRPRGAVGYSLGETAALFALGIWPDRGQMLQRMQANPLFTTELSGPCESLRKAWKVPAGETFEWRVAVVNRSAAAVKKALASYPWTRLLIVNTPAECVIGGERRQIDAVIQAMQSRALFLAGVVTVHCDAAQPVADAYRALHHFPETRPPAADFRFYSCAHGRRMAVSGENAAESILHQALYGFDFPRVINQIYDDGGRIFVELGPHASCTRMIDNILGQRPHLAVSACRRGEDPYFTILKLLGNLAAEGVALDLDQLYGHKAYPPLTHTASSAPHNALIHVPVHGRVIEPVPPPRPTQGIGGPEIKEPDRRDAAIASGVEAKPPPDARRAPPVSAEPGAAAENASPYTQIIARARDNLAAVAKAHETYLELSGELTQAMGAALQQQSRQMTAPARAPAVEASTSSAPADAPARPLFDRDMCMEFAIGSVAKVLGPDFAPIDGYPVRVRLPDEPLMLVDRILSVAGEKRSLSAGRVITEHDVRADAWYLDGGRAPVCIAVEAGQADLFLSSYLGIDHAVQGQRAYRLLDAAVTFHRGLPRPGETIRYDIHIDKFVRQGPTYLFFFRFKGFINGEPLITMTDGCAGFFTEAEVQNSGGIILTEEEQRPRPGRRPADWRDLVPMAVEHCGEPQVEALRRGDLAACFGEPFAAKRLSPSLWLPGGRMHLIDRILHLDPHGGRFGMGLVRAEADIHPEDWFLTCHFVDDRVMPGTLMYECCAHALRVLLLGMGWISENSNACYEPVVGVAARLKCRGPVTPHTRRVIYEVAVKEIGFTPQPFVIADAQMFADGRHIVSFKGMSLQMTHVTRQEIESLWQGSPQQDRDQVRKGASKSQPLFDRHHILAFAKGKPSEAFGEPYRIFDDQRVIARLPSPPFSFMDRIVDCPAPPWELKPCGWTTAEYDVPPDAWYFSAEGTGAMPFCVLLEVALQPCGWLAAYLGSALHSTHDLKFRNLGGSATLHRPVDPGAGTLTMRARLTKFSEAGAMIIEHFDFAVLQQGQPVYEGNTYFGFFTAQTLAHQQGLRDLDRSAFNVEMADTGQGLSQVFADRPPLTPQEADRSAARLTGDLVMPAKALRMIDAVACYLAEGGGPGLGYIRGSKTVDPGEWFFAAHFHQDPVWPGSLGIESFIQLLKFAALQRWPHLTRNHTFRSVMEKPHQWSYRGQVIPRNQRVKVEAVVTRVETTPRPALFGDGILSVDGLAIYHMQNFGIEVVAP